MSKTWERAGNRQPIVLYHWGGIVAQRTLSDETIATVQSVIKDSLELAMADPDAALPTMRKYAQEFDDEVLMKHVELYVNQWTVDLGEVGSSSLNKLSDKAIEVGLVPESAGGIEVFSG